MSSIRTRRSILFTGVGVVAGALVAACGGPAAGTSDSSGAPVSGGSITVAIDAEPAGGFDPHIAQAYSDQQIISQFYEGLLSLDDKGAVKPGLAEKYQQVDPTTYRFTLRDGLFFHDGSAVTTDDVAFSLMRLMDPAIKSPFTKQYHIKSVKSVDAHTVEVKLSSPQPSLYNFLARPWSGAIMSKAWTTSHSEDQIKQAENGTGPFTLTAWKKGVSIEVARNAKYWDSPKPYLSSATFRLIPDETSRLAALRSGSAQLVALRDLRLVDDIKSTPGFTSANGPIVSSVWLGMNAATGPLADKRVRQAVNLAIDRQALIKTLGSSAVSLGFVIPPQDPYGTTPTGNEPMYRQDQAKAKALLAEAGQPTVNLELMAGSEPAYAPDVAAMELMKAQLAQVGINLQLKLTPFATIVQHVLSGDFPSMVLMTSVLNADPSQYVNLWFAKGAPTTKVNDPHLWDLMTAAENEPDQAKRVTLYQDLARYVADQAYLLVPYAKAVRAEVWSDKVHGYAPDATATRLNLKNAWVSR